MQKGRLLVNLMEIPFQLHSRTKDALRAHGYPSPGVLNQHANLLPTNVTIFVLKCFRIIEIYGKDASHGTHYFGDDYYCQTATSLSI